jgi:sec-independent protein translocase protein TatA
MLRDAFLFTCDATLLTGSKKVVFPLVSCNLHDFFAFYFAKGRNFVFLTNKKFIMLLSIVNLLFISMPGGSEWLLIVLAVLVLFGGRKIPEFMRGIGRGIREFNDAKNNVKKEIEDGINEKDTKQASSTTQAH